MSFADHEYLPFLALVLALFQFVPARARGGFLLLASLAFYAHWEPWQALVLVAVIAADYLCARGIERARGTGARRALVGAALAVNLGLLASFKYSPFLAANANVLLRAARWPELPIPHPVLPLGLSFYAFQGLGYVLDVARGRLRASEDPWHFALFVAFFPQLVAGPIERAERLLPQLRALQPLNAPRLLSGAGLVAWGLLKKRVLADHLKLLAWPLLEAPGAAHPAALLVGAFALYVMLYLDFSAYTDLARGSARLFGVELTLNFRLPLAARTPGDLAQRWHMSLYWWIRDYALAPLARGPLTHGRIWRNALLVLGLFGLWHGASWSFVLWGLGSGVVIAIQHSWRLARTRAGARRPPRSGWGPGGWLAWVATQTTAALFIVLFFAPDLASAGRFFAGLLAPAAAPLAREHALLAAGLAALYLGQVAVERIGLARVELAWTRLHPLARTAGLAAVVVAVALLRVPQPLPFVYFQF